jgi:predicted acylesterase/phospholipase RssA
LIDRQINFRYIEEEEEDEDDKCERQQIEQRELDFVRQDGAVSALSLSGGGSRVIGQLGALKAIRLPENKTFMDYFPTAIGSSAGGIVALR